MKSGWDRAAWGKLFACGALLPALYSCAGAPKSQSTAPASSSATGAGVAQKVTIREAFIQFKSNPEAYITVDPKAVCYYAPNEFAVNPNGAVLHAEQTEPNWRLVGNTYVIMKSQVWLPMKDLRQLKKRYDGTIVKPRRGKPTLYVWDIRVPDDWRGQVAKKPSLPHGWRRVFHSE